MFLRCAAVNACVANAKTILSTNRSASETISGAPQLQTACLSGGGGHYCMFVLVLALFALF